MSVQWKCFASIKFVREACEDDPNVWWEIVTMSLNSTEIAPHMVAMYSDDGSEMSLS
jgi:hypothetical protein